MPPETAEFDTKDYEAHLSLDYIGQPTILLGTDSLGTFVGGGIGFFWSDLLGNHHLGAAVQASGSFRDIGGQVGYQNLANRLNWGVVVQHLPFRTGGVSRTVATVDGTPAVVDQVLISRETHTDFNVIAAYPFSRAQRIEVFGGLKTIGFSRTLDIEAFSLATGATLIDEQRELPSLDRINLGRAGAALVYDTALYGVTSPIRGGRYRLEIAQSAGSLTYSTALADFRRYFMPVRPITIAMRGMHYGRYGGDADDTRLFPLFLGYPNLVRGYDVESFRASECPVGTDGSCPVFDNLLGSRLLVANLELRAPVWGLFGGEQFYGPLPLEVAVFADAGVAWTGDESPSFAGGSRDFVKSVGVAVRANVFNYLIAEIDFVRPLDRPGRGWIWQFNFTPGF